MLPQRIDGLELQEAGDELLVHNPNTNKIHVLNASAGIVLRLCDGAHDVSGIVDTLASGVDVDRSVVTRHTLGILQEFQVLGLLHELQIDGDSSSNGEAR